MMIIIPIKLVGFVNKAIVPLSSACTFTSFGVHENTKLQPTTVVLLVPVNYLSTTDLHITIYSALSKIVPQIYHFSLNSTQVRGT